jgi:hypothetical protein
MVLGRTLNCGGVNTLQDLLKGGYGGPMTRNIFGGVFPPEVFWFLYHPCTRGPSGAVVGRTVLEVGVKAPHKDCG